MEKTDEVRWEEPDDEFIHYSYTKWCTRENELLAELNEVKDIIRKKVKKDKWKWFAAYAGRYIAIKKDIQEVQDINDKYQEELKEGKVVRAKEFLIHP